MNKAASQSEVDSDSPSAITDSSNPSSSYPAFDEWRRDTIFFPTKTDALLAKLAFSTDMHPAVLDNVFHLLQDPTFNLAECTLKSEQDIHSYAHDFRKTVNRRPVVQLEIPAFVRDEIMIIIGSRWVDFVSALYEDNDHWDYRVEVFEPKFILNQDVLDLRSASLVHSSWTGPAQRQLGRVLLLNKPTKKLMDAALRSPLLGNWTQTLAVRGCDGVVLRQSRRETIDMLLPNLTLMETLVRRLPCLTRVYLKTTLSSHPLLFLRTLIPARSLKAIHILFNNYNLLAPSDELFSMFSHWNDLRSMYLVGFSWRQDFMDLLNKMSATKSNPMLSNVLVSAFQFNLQSASDTRTVCLERRQDETFQPKRIYFRKYMNASDEDDTVDFKTLSRDPIISLLPKFEEISMENMYTSEVDQILHTSEAVRYVKWACVEDSLPLPRDVEVPDLLFPPTLRDFELVVRANSTFQWHVLDRKLQSFIQRNSNRKLRNLILSIKLRDHSRDEYLETDEEVPQIYFPRTSRLCATLGTSITATIRNLERITDSAFFQYD